MILHPGILALLSGSSLVLLMLMFAGGVGLQVLRRWRPEAADEQQLRLERRTYLVSVLVNYALLFMVLSLPLFMYTVDDIHQLFVGAMCATGSLNANPVGWSVLVVKLALAFLAGLWVVANHYDLQVAEMPLIRAKYLALLFLVPLVAADAVLQWHYFSGLTPEVITSCCGSLFSASGQGVAAGLAGLPVKPMMVIFYAGLALFAGLVGVNLLGRRGFLRYLLAIGGSVFLVVALAAVISFLSLYIYQLPTHHCPFDMFQQGYNFIGYPLYLGLFGAVFCATVPAVLEMARRRHPVLGAVVDPAEIRWIVSAAGFLALFVLIATWPVVFGPLSLRGWS